MRPTRLFAIVVLVLVGGLVGLGIVNGRDSADTSEALLEVSPSAVDGATDPKAADSTLPETRGEPTTTLSPTPPTPTTQTTEAASDAMDDAPPILGTAPTLEDLDGWLQTDVNSFEEIDAPVRVVQFWTFGCYNCKNTLEHMAGMYETYHDAGLEIVGVHAPEFDFEKDPDAIAAAAVELNVTWPIALDTDKKNFRSWQGARRFWPRVFVLDADDNIRFDHIGEGAYDELEETVAWLIEHQT